jgi:hypothetical protein
MLTGESVHEPVEEPVEETATAQDIAAKKKAAGNPAAPGRQGNPALADGVLLHVSGGLAIALLPAAVTLLGLIRAAAGLLMLAGLTLRALVGPLARLLRLLAGLVALLPALLATLVLVSFRVVHSITSKGTIAHGSKASEA